MTKNLLGSLLLSGLTLTAYADVEKVSLPNSDLASLKILKLFSEEATLKARLHGVHVDLSQISQSSCAFDIVRPTEKTDPALSDPSNAINCTVKNRAGAKKSVKIDLSDLLIQAWGARRERSIAFEDKNAEIFYDALARQIAKAPEDPMYWDMGRICGPDGSVCMQMLAINQAPDIDSVGALICSKEWLWDSVTKKYKLDNTLCTIVDDRPVPAVDPADPSADPPATSAADPANDSTSPN